MDKAIHSGKKSGDDSTGRFCGDAFCCCLPQASCGWELSEHLDGLKTQKLACGGSARMLTLNMHKCLRKTHLFPTAHLFLNTKCTKKTKNDGVNPEDRPPAQGSWPLLGSLS